MCLKRQFTSGEIAAAIELPLKRQCVVRHFDSLLEMELNGRYLCGHSEDVTLSQKFMLNFGKETTTIIWYVIVFLGWMFGMDGWLYSDHWRHFCCHCLQPIQPHASSNLRGWFQVLLTEVYLRLPICSTCGLRRASIIFCTVQMPSAHHHSRCFHHGGTFREYFLYCNCSNRIEKVTSL